MNKKKKDELTGKQILAGLLASIAAHLIFILLLTWLAMFVWNVGFVGIANIAPIPFGASYAVMFGIYFVGLIVRFILAQRRRRKALDEAIRKFSGYGGGK